MWIKHRLRELPTVYLLLILFLMVQVFVAIQFFKEGDAYLNYRMNSNHLIQYAKAMRGNYAIASSQDTGDPLMEKMKIWAQNGEEVSLYTRDVFAKRYFQNESKNQDDPPINEDLHILFDLANLYGFDYQGNGVPRPEMLIGKQKWEQLRQYYQNLGTPSSIMNRLLPPYEQFLGDKAGDAPVLQKQSAYYFYIQKILNYVDIVLSDFPAMQFHAAPPVVLLIHLLGNRSILMFLIVLCVFLTSAQVAQDRQLGTIRLIASMQNGRTRYFLFSLKGAFLLVAGGLLLSFFPGLLLSVSKYGVKGFNYPIPCLPYSYQNLSPFPLDRGEMVSNNSGIYIRARLQNINPASFGEMRGTIEAWKLLLLAVLFLFLLICLMLFIGFLVSTLSKNKNITVAIGILPVGLAAASLYDAHFASASFPFNPFASMDIMATATGMQDFTVLSALIALIAWNLLAFLLGFLVIKRKSLG